MGRPLNKRYFGEPTTDGDEIKVRFYDTTNTQEVNGWIVKQLGSKKFRVTDGTVTEDCFLSTADDGALTSGDMTITVKDDADAVQQVTKISGRVVTLEDGSRTAWTFTTSAVDEKVEIEEAGTDGDLAGADDFDPDA